MENQIFCQRRTSLVSVPTVYEWNKNYSSSIPKQTTHVSTNECRLNSQTCQGYKVSRLPILTSGVDGRTVAHAARASETTDNTSKAAAAASEDAARSASRAQDSISRAKEALRADSATKTRRVAEARASAKSLPLAATATTAAPVPIPAPGSGTSD